MKVTRKVEGLKDTADEWELYAEVPGAEACATRLNKMLMDLVNSGSTRDEVYEAMCKYMSLEENSKFGAADSEPEYNLRHLLRRIYEEA